VPSLAESALGRRPPADSCCWSHIGSSIRPGRRARFCNCGRQPN